jgi:hypothetical protein
MVLNQMNKRGMTNNSLLYELDQTWAFWGKNYTRIKIKEYRKEREIESNIYQKTAVNQFLQHADSTQMLKQITES